MQICVEGEKRQQRQQKCGDEIASPASKRVWGWSERPGAAVQRKFYFSQGFLSAIFWSIYTTGCQ